ncbi:hypothetical protein L596_013900 [Steinernema carpocapsae]|uniref:TIL domain-containing protein n=1 Tax=Steinernema carpocapsae TaxID=34508 RepID=A0A4U5P1J0_STECR|nr:hypothetical protein L596_013900 [Steinernema carpocapsae]
MIAIMVKPLLLAALVALSIAENLLDEKKCGPNEKWVEVPLGFCDSRCDGTCERPFNPICTLDCKPSRCMCNTGYVRNNEGKCISLSACPAKKCPFGEEWRECSGCDGTCQKPNPACTLDSARRNVDRTRSGKSARDVTEPVRTLILSVPLIASLLSANEDRICPKRPRKMRSCGQLPEEMWKIWQECSGCDGTCQNPNPICTADCKPPTS